MSTDYNYDEQGQFFPYFIFTISALVTLPLSYSLLKPTDHIENTAPRIKSDFKPLEDDLIEGQRNKQWRKERRIKRLLTVGVGYVTMAVMLYLIAVTKASTPTVWDPYDILGLSITSNESQIKKRYRDLSRTLHPDKAVPDQSRNETAETINDHWVEVSKAFKALTDEEVRKNYIQYGHPDGKQGFSIGIALPKFIITEGNGKYVLMVYGILLGILLPYLVGKWWYGTQKVTKEKVLLQTASSLFQEYREDLNDADVLSNLSGGREFGDTFQGGKVDAGLGSIERTILEPTDQDHTAAGLSMKDQERLKSFEGARRKADALLWAYLGRLKLGSNVSDAEKYEVAPMAYKLLDSFVSISLAFGNTVPLLSAYRLSQHIIQAIPPSGSPLLQLPYMGDAVARSIESTAGQDHLSVQQLMAMPEYKRRKLCTDLPAPAASLTPEQYNKAMAVARQLPYLHVEKAFFKVMGERFITPGSLVQLVVKARVIPPGISHIPEVDPLDLEDVDPDEGDIDELLGRKPPKSKAKVLDNSNNDASNKFSEDKPLVPPLAYAPYFPQDHSPRWHFFLADSKMGKIAVPPFTMTTFNKPPFHESSSTPTPTFNVQTFKMQFQAPPQAGKYAFIMHAVCDSYIGTDSQRDVVLEVESAEKAAEMLDAEEDDISEPEEDSLAGQMRAMQTGGLAGVANAAAAPKKSKKKVVEEEEEDDDDDEESGTDEEEDEESETDTETEDEDGDEDEDDED